MPSIGAVRIIDTLPELLTNNKAIDVPQVCAPGCRDGAGFLHDTDTLRHLPWHLQRSGQSSTSKWGDMRWFLHILFLISCVALLTTCLFPKDDPPPPAAEDTPDPRCGDTDCTVLPSLFRNDRCGDLCDRENGQACAGDQCRCTDGGAYCYGDCVDLSVDPANCGRCRHDCNGTACVDGVCDCPDGQEMCEGYCHPDSYFARTVAHCGACYAECVGYCRQGECLTVVDFDLGTTNTAVVLSDGSAWVWGKNDYGQIGVIDDGDDAWRGPPRSGSPHQVPGVDSAVAIAFGEAHGCALLSGGDVMCWGWNTTNVAGPNGDEPASTPVVVPGLADVADISVGSQHSCALTHDGRVYTWGSNMRGQLGDGTAWIRPEPALIPGVDGVRELRCQDSRTCIRQDDGVRCVGGAWGENPTDIVWSQHLTGLPAPIRQFDVSRDAGHVCAVTGETAADTPGTVYCVGRNLDGQVGQPPSEGAGPAGPREAAQAVQVATSYDSTCSMNERGEVWCWGSNNEGQMSDRLDTTNTVNRVDLQGSAIAIDGDGHHFCALLSSGDLKCWGWNLYFQVRGIGGSEIIEPVSPGWHF